jgi:hypothetical protein
MSYSFESLDDGHILILTMHKDFDIRTEMIESSLKVYEMLDQSPDQVVLISDSREIQLNNLNDLIEGANLARRDEARRVSQHPHVLKNYSIVNNRLAQAAVKGLNTASFGYFEVTMFETLEEAISQARAVLAEAKEGRAADGTSA